MTRTALFMTLLSTLGFAGTAFAAPSAKPIRLKPNSSTSVRDNIARGETIDLAWATKSSVACFPSIRNSHFDGKHVLFTVDLPAKSVLKIEAKPRGNQDISLYAYSVGTTSKALPPNLSSVVSCEADFGKSTMGNPPNPGEAESVELNATTNPYRVVIGVAGADKLDKAAFILKLDLKTAAPAKTGAIASAKPIKAKANASVSVAGDIKTGTEIDLQWAANSSVACFPATRFDHFDGKQVAYSFSLPKYTRAKIELTPKGKDKDLSLYAYSMGTTRNDLPPNVPSVVSCEASYGTNSMSKPYNPGGAESVELMAINNPYNAIIVVAGAQGLGSGAFDLKVTLSPR